MTIQSWLKSLAQSRRQTIRNSVPRRERLLVEELESRLAPATFAQVGTALSLDMNVANKSVAIVSAGSTYTFTLAGDTWSGTNSANVTGNGTSTLTVTSAGLAALNQFTITDSAAGSAVTFANSGANAYSDTFNVTLDSAPAATSVQFTGTSSFSSTNTLSVNTTQGVSLVAGSTLTMGTGTLTLSADTASVGGNITSSGAVSVNVRDINSTGTISTLTGLTVNNTGTASTLAGNITGPGSLTKNGAGTLILTGSKTYGGTTIVAAGTLQLGNGTTNGSVNTAVNNSGTLAFNNPTIQTFVPVISGSGSVTVAGAGILTFSGANTYSGLTTINSGSTLKLGTSNAMSANSIISGAGTLDINNFSPTIAGLQGATITNNANTFTSATLNVAAGTLNGTIKDGPTAKTSVTIVGSNVTIAGTNTYSGSTNIVPTNGILKVGSTDGTSPNSSISFAGTNASLDLNGFDTSAAGAVGTGGFVTNNGANAAALTVTGVGGGSVTARFINGTAPTGLTIGGVSGTTVNMSGAFSASTFSGPTTINSGNTLKLLGPNATSANSTISGVGTLDLNNTTNTIGGLQDATITNNANSFTTATLNVANGTLNGTIKDGPTAKTSVTIVGLNVTIAGTNTYSGSTNIISANSVVKVGATNGSSPNSVITFAGINSKLDLNSFDSAIAGLLGNGSVILGSGTLTIGGASTSTNFSGSISGTGGLTKVGTGNLTLSGNNPYFGTTTISGGTLQINNLNSLGTGDIVDDGTLLLSVAAPMTINSVISGGGSISKSIGTLTLNGANTFTGTFQNNSGTLIVNGSLADGPAATDLTIVNGTLAGAGTIAGATLVQNTSTVAPGSNIAAAGFGPGILHTGDITFASTSSLSVQLNGTTVGTQYDQLSSTGAVDLGGANLNVTLSFTPPANSVFTIVSAASVTGTFNGLSDGALLTVSGRQFRVNYTSTTVTLTESSNTPPTIASDTASVTVDEGGVATNTGTFADAQGNNTVTITASIGTVTQDDNAGTWSWSLAAVDGPAGPFTVTITARDSQNAVATTTFTYSIDNVPPTISLSGNATVDEGAVYTLNLGVVIDPGQDTITNYTINWGDGIIDSFIGNPANTTATHVFADGPANQVNNVTVTDEDGVFLAGSLGVQVLNVAPTAQLNNAGSVNEGSSGIVSFADQFDPSPADSDFHYAYDFDNDGTFDSGDGTYAGSTTDGASVTIPASYFADGPGTRIVLGRIIDKDGGYTDYTTTITIDNVAPTAQLNNGGAVNEGSSGTVSFSDQFDPSAADNVFHYAYDFDNDGTFDSGDGTYAGSTTDGASVTVPASYFADGPGTRIVLGRIIDKDGGYTDYTTEITINNVAPTVTLSGPTSANEGDVKHFTFTTSDPGTIDTFSVGAVSGGAVGTVSNLSFNPITGAGSFDVTFNNPAATSAVSVQVTDNNNATSNVASIDVTVADVTPTLTIAKSASVPSISEGGVGNQSVTYTYTITNTSAASTDPVALTSVLDDQLGELLPQAIAANGGNPVVLAPNAQLTFMVTTTLPTHNAGVSEVNTASVTGHDDENDSATAASAPVSVAYTDVTPTITVAKSADVGSVNEGGVGNQSVTYTFTITNVSAATTDPVTITSVIDDSLGDLLSAFIAANGGSAILAPSASVTFSQAFIVPVQNANTTYTSAVNVAAQDDEADGATADASVSIAYLDVAPTVQVTKIVDPTSVSEGGYGNQQVTYTYTLQNVSAASTDSSLTLTQFSDNRLGDLLGNASITGDADHNDRLDFGETWTLVVNSTVPPQNAGTTYTNVVTVTADDDEGSSDDDSAEATVTYTDVAPTVTLIGAASASEGQTLHYTFSISDPGTNETFSIVATSGGSVGTISNLQLDQMSRTGSFDVTFSDGPATSAVSIQVADSHNANSNVSSIPVAVANVAPVVTSLSVDHSSINMGETATLSGVFTDPGVLDTHTVVINWGDGSAVTTLTLPANVLSFSVGHQYVNTEVGNPAYTISVTVTDKDFGVGFGTASISVLSSIYVLNQTAVGALSISGNASIHVGGLVDVDSNTAAALQASGNAVISAGSIRVTGGVQQSGNATLSSFTTSAPVAPDPLASLPVPTLADLGLSSMPTPASVNLNGNDSLTINPGVYSQIKVSGNAHLTLNPGIYVLAGGGLTVTGNGSITGNGVMLYNAGSNFVTSSGPTTFGGLTLSGNGNIRLTPIASGTFAGILIFQSRDNTRAMSLSGNALAMQGGAIYAQQALVAVSGNADIRGSLVVNRLQLSGNASSALATEGGGAVNTAGELLAGDLVIYVDNSSGAFTADELARIADAVDALNLVINPYGVAITLATEAERDWATTVLQISNTSPVGSALDGVLGCESEGYVTIVDGWNWYTGADSGAVGAGQYDFQTIVTHELGHALGLGHSADSNSAMFATLNAGEAHRTISAADLAIPDIGAVACALHAASATPNGTPAVAMPATNQILIGNGWVSPSDNASFNASIEAATQHHNQAIAQWLADNESAEVHAPAANEVELGSDETSDDLFALPIGASVDLFRTEGE